MGRAGKAAGIRTLLITSRVVVLSSQAACSNLLVRSQRWGDIPLNMLKLLFKAR